MSFEFHGGFIALNDLIGFGTPKAQAESVAEAIIRHQDPAPQHTGYTIPAGADIDAGTITRLGQLTQISTEFDNMGFQPWLIDQDVIEQVVKQLPRLKWSSCFSRAIRAEVEVSELPLHFHSQLTVVGETLVSYNRPAHICGGC